MSKLTDVAVRNAKPRNQRYELREFSGLSLRVNPKGSKAWVWRYRFEGKQKRMTLGTYPKVTLSQARTALAMAQDKLARDIDPADARPVRDTVADLVDLYRTRHLPNLRSAEHQERRLRVDILPSIGHPQAWRPDPSKGGHGTGKRKSTSQPDRPSLQVRRGLGFDRDFAGSVHTTGRSGNIQGRDADR